MAFDRVVQRLASAGGKLRVRSALNPILWLCAVFSAPGLLLLAVLESLPIWAIVIVSAPPLVACASYMILLFRDPDKLQSEEYQINKQLIEFANEKGIDPASLLSQDRPRANPENQLTVDSQEEDR